MDNIILDNIILDNMRQIIKNHFVGPADTALFFNMTITDFISAQKFTQLSAAMNNMFLTQEQKHKILLLFCDIQRFIHSIYRLKYVWKFKRANIYNTDDLYMHPIHPESKNTIQLMQNNTKYVFHIRELIGTINTSLANSSHFFADPIAYKNPYTNLPFSKSALYNIYFAVKSSTYIMPILLQKYFMCDFNLSIFASHNDYLVNEEYLDQYVANNCYENLLKRVNEMFDMHKLYRLKLHVEFPKDVLFKIMKPYLELYYTSQYSMNEYKKSYSYRVLHSKLYLFTKYNPNFGRKKMKLIRSAPFSKHTNKEIIFNTDHLPFHQTKQSTSEFMKAHLFTKINYGPAYDTSNYMPTFRMQHYDDDDEEQRDDDEVDITRNLVAVNYNRQSEESGDESEESDDDEETIFDDASEDSDDAPAENTYETDLQNELELQDDIDYDTVD